MPRARICRRRPAASALVSQSAVAVPRGAGLGAAERRRLQPYRRHRRPRRYRLRPGAGLAVARSRHRRDPARYQAVAGPARLPLRRPRRVAAAPGGGASAGRLLADPSGAAERAFEAALRRAGVLYVASLEDLLAAAEILARARPVRSEALSIVTNAIGAGRMAADAVLRDGLQLAGDIVPRGAGRRACRPTPRVQLADRCDRAAARAGRRRRPGGARTDRRGRSRDDRGARRGRDAMKVPLLVCAMGETTGAAHRRSLAEAGMAVFATPEQAVRGFLHLVQDRRNRAAARELPTQRGADAWRPTATRCATCSPRFAAPGDSPRRRTRRWRCCRAYGIPVVPNRAVASRRRCGGRRRRCWASPPW